jgi:hypothetical protein
MCEGSLLPVKPLMHLSHRLDPTLARCDSRRCRCKNTEANNRKTLSINHFHTRSFPPSDRSSATGSSLELSIVPEKCFASVVECFFVVLDVIIDALCKPASDAVQKPPWLQRQFCYEKRPLALVNPPDLCYG